MTARYRIGEFAALSGVPVKTLRFYDEIGLLRPASIDHRTRYRHYLPRQLPELASILALRNLGVPLADIRRVTGKTAPDGERREVLKELRRTVEHSMQAAASSLHWIDSALKELEGPERDFPVVVKHRPEFTIASVRAKVKSYDGIVPLERELLNALPPESLGDVRGVLWHSCADSGSLEGEPFIAIKRPVPRRSTYQVKVLPSVMAAAAYSGVDDESAERAYRSLHRWMATGGYQIAGPKREIYIEDLLEIQFPFRASQPLSRAAKYFEPRITASAHE